MRALAQSPEAVRLADYLRRNPQAVNAPPDQLAEEAQVPLGLVRRACLGADSFAQRQRLAEATRRKRQLPGWYRALSEPWMRMTSNASLFVVVTTVTCITIATAVTDETLTAARGFNVVGWLPLAIYLTVLALHLLMYARHAQAKVVLWGTVSLFAVLVPCAAILAFYTRTPETSYTTQFFLLSFAFLVFCLAYTLFGLFFAVVSAFIRIRIAAADRASMSRQELLKRMFEVYDGLVRGPSEASTVKDWRNHPLVVQFESRPYQWALVLGLGLSAVVELLTAGMMVRFNIDDQANAIFVVRAFFGLLGTALNCFLAFINRTFLGALSVSLTYNVAGVLPWFLPVGAFGQEYIHTNLDTSVLMTVAFAIFIGVLCGTATIIERSATRQRLLAANDPESLLAEFMDLLRRLSPSPRMVNIMVVDAAQSSMMKQLGDVFVSEWSFRAYQQFLERVTREFQGEVIHTAGDGAIMTFEDPIDALGAAEAIQDGIHEFNLRVNKLPTPFRLRVGLHRGPIVGHVEKVQFTEVIDVAAHVEGASQVGGIAASEPFWDALPGLRGQPIEQVVDGFRVYHLEMVGR